MGVITEKVIHFSESVSAYPTLTWNMQSQQVRQLHLQKGWQTTAPKWRKDYYIWSRTHIYYTDGNEKVSTPMCLSVARSIDRIEECYYSSHLLRPSPEVHG